MANYVINIVDNGDGTFSYGAWRSPAAFGSGGTNLLTSSAAGGGFLQAATDGSDGLGHQLRNPQEVLGRASAIIQADRSYNG